MQNTPISARKGLYAQVIVWLLLIDLICASDDILSFYLDQSLHPIQVSFIRFVVNAVSVLPWMLPKGLTYFRTKKAGLHFWRGVLGAVAIGSVTISVIKMPLMKNTCLSFTEPLFLLPLAALFEGKKLARPSCGLFFAWDAGDCRCYVPRHSDVQFLGGFASPECFYVRGDYGDCAKNG